MLYRYIIYVTVRVRNGLICRLTDRTQEVRKFYSTSQISELIKGNVRVRPDCVLLVVTAAIVTVRNKFLFVGY